ncbi:hypothetical protein BK004_01280 [bacterium CG10_46_32]|nr:MAG: hypothetical protein BK004_01280 [bacterium CG10_46_32]PIR56331.1 MAG: methyltransferase type 11 [Parcubacteria group bacterium CG10_big_fil_rev_8_21_14_0_10_46_32]
MSDNQKNKYYDFLYEPLPRWSSYWYQIHEVLSRNPKTVLEVGVGNHVVTEYLKHAGVSVTTLDVEKKLAPDVVASVTAIPLADASHDVVLAAEVLEHLPFEDFSKALAEINRVTKQHAVISLPHWGSVIAGTLKVPMFPWLRFVWKLKGFKRHILSQNGHYWEIGKAGYPLGRVKREMHKAGFEIIKDYVIIEYPYHHFFILKKQAV